MPRLLKNDHRRHQTENDPHDQASLRKPFYADLKAAEIARLDSSGRSIDIHSLRKTFGTMLARAGVPLTTTQRLMRHSTPQITAKLYIDVDGGKAFRRGKTVPTTGLVTRRIYDAETGLDAAHIDAAGRTTVFTYDAMRRRVKETLFKLEGKNRKLIRETCSQVDVRRGVSVQTDALGNKTQSIVDVFGRTVATVNALGNRTEMVYNRLGELLEQRDPMGRTTRFVYDNLGRRVETILPAPKPGEENPVQRVVYDAHGRVVQQIDPLGNATAMEYDAHGRVARQVNAEGGVTSFTYTEAGQLKTLTDPVGNTTSYEYDDLARPIKETNELGKSRFFEYLAGKMMAKKTDRNGRVTTFDHDDYGRVTAEKWYETDKVVKTLAFEYNALGHLKKVDDGVTVFDYSRDEDGRELSATMALPGLVDPIVQQTEYDVLGRRTQIATAFGGQVEFSDLYTYTKIGQVESISQDGKQVNYHYDAAGMRIAAMTPVVDTLYSYDGMGRLTQIKHGDIAQYDYAWDAANRITSMNDAQYGYDATSQLISAVYDKLPSEAYDYDANGNRKAYETGKNNQLLTDGVFDYTYDDEGNRIEKRSKDSLTRYEWDHRNRLVRVLDNGKSVEYDYDYQSRLVRRNNELFVHDGWQVVCSLKNGRLAHRYLWGAVQDELLAVDGTWALRDHLNTVRKVVDAKGEVISSLEYNAFGKLVSSTGDKPLFRYTGKMFDDTTGLQWNINRWYDANVGRWVSEDPIKYRGGDYNLLRYVRTYTIGLTDAMGLLPDPPSEKRKEFCCAWLKIWNQGDIAGTVVCCDGYLVPCNWHPDKNEAGVVQDAVNKCIMEHENDHIQNDFKDPPCPVLVPSFIRRCPPYRARTKYNNKDDNNKAECRAYQTELDCLHAEVDKLEEGEDKENLKQIIKDKRNGANKDHKCLDYNIILA